MEHEGSLLPSQQLAVWLYHVPNESSPHPASFVLIHCNFHFLFSRWPSKPPHSFRFLYKNPKRLYLLYRPCHVTRPSHPPWFHHLNNRNYWTYESETWQPNLILEPRLWNTKPLMGSKHSDVNYTFENEIRFRVSDVTVRIREYVVVYRIYQIMESGEVDRNREGSKQRERRIKWEAKMRWQRGNVKLKDERRRKRQK